MKNLRSFSAARVRVMVVLFAVAAALSFALVVAFGGAFYSSEAFAATRADIAGEWIASVGKKDPSDIHITFSRSSAGPGFNMSGETFKAAELQGVTPAQIGSAMRADVRFTMAADAGTFACEGMFREGRGTGFWTFSPSEAFRTDMKGRGYGYLNDEELLRAALTRLTLKYIDELKSAGYGQIEYKELVRAAGDGVTAAFIRELKAAGFTAPTIEQLARAADNGVTAAYMRDIQATGLANLTLDTISRAADEKVTPAFIVEMKGAGFSSLTLENIIRLKDEDVTAKFVEEIRAEGYPDITPSLAIRLKDEDVDSSFIRRAKAQGYNVSLQEMIRLKNRGTVKLSIDE